MSAAERVIIVSMGRAPDPLLEEIIAAEGYEVTHADSVQTMFRHADPASVGAVVLLVGDSTQLQITHVLQEAAKGLDHAKFLLCVGNRQGHPLSLKVSTDLTSRVLLVRGESGSAENVDRIRRFLRGEGYRWASDLGSLGKEASLLDGTPPLTEAHRQEMRQLLRFASDLSKFTELKPMLQEALTRCLEIFACDAGSIYLWDEHTETLILEAAVGPERDQRLGLRQKLGEGLAGWVAEVGEPILVSHLQNPTQGNALAR